jgi:drug/metabolite transporter (DMT)-like permease
LKDAVHAGAHEVISGRIFALTSAALVSFALNSLLCRAALGAEQIDATTFTSIRLASGALVLWLIVRANRARSEGGGPVPFGDVALSAAALFAYALPFSLAYRGLSAGTGAFIVFGCVQITMISAGLISGRSLHAREIGGLCLALLGLVVLTRPGQESPDLTSALLMALAGFAWGLYSLRGRRAGPPLQATARNFAAAVPLALVASALSFGTLHITPRGLFLATLSGAVTSGLGYVAWYAALPSLSPARAAIVQLAVPPLASFLGILILGESLTQRLALAAPMILGGIAIAVPGVGAARPQVPVVRDRGSI